MFPWLAVLLATLLGVASCGPAAAPPKSDRQHVLGQPEAPVVVEEWVDFL